MAQPSEIYQVKFLVNLKFSIQLSSARCTVEFLLANFFRQEPVKSSIIRDVESGVVKKSRKYDF